MGCTSSSSKEAPKTSDAAPQPKKEEEPKKEETKKEEPNKSEPPTTAVEPQADSKDASAPLADALQDAHNYATYTVGVSKLADYVGEKDGKRHVEMLSEEAVHGEAWSHLVAQRRRLSKHFGKRSPYAEEVAQVIVDRAKGMAKDVAEEHPDIMHDKWKRYKSPLSFMMTGQEDEPHEKLGLVMEELCIEMVKHSKEESTLNEAVLPAKIFGDLHGHFRDLLLFLHHYGFPAADGPDFIFNGDWVDRGKHQLETLALIFALKLAYPANVHLNRGNHEDSAVNRHMGHSGLWHHCHQEWPGVTGKKLYKEISESFEWLPLATLAGHKIFVCHGGIGDGNWDVQHVKNTARPLSTTALAADPILYNLLWSDPIDEDQGSKSFGVHSSPRVDHAGIMKQFGKDVTAKFLERNKLGMVVRSHEALVEGEGYEIMHDSKLMRVFSARDYEGQDNDGGILTVDVLVEKKELIVRPQVLHSLKKRR